MVSNIVECNERRKRSYLANISRCLRFWLREVWIRHNRILFDNRKGLIREALVSEC